MTIYLHCGGHKTASSFMKMLLRKNKALFEAHKIAIHLDEFRDRAVTPEEIIQLAKADYRQNYEQIIISEDANIIGLMPGIFQSCDRNFFHSNSILQFANLVARINQQYPTKFLLCVRRQDTYLESCYKFRKIHGAKYDWEYFLNQVQKINLSWLDVVNTVASYIGQENCLVTPYELLKQSPTEFITTFFRSILSLDLQQVVIPPPNNQGASTLMMAIVEYLDTEFSEIPSQHRREIIATIKKYQTKNTSDNSLFSESDQVKLLEKYATDNQQLFATYLSELPVHYYHPRELHPSNQPLVINN